MLKSIDIDYLTLWNASRPQPFLNSDPFDFRNLARMCGADSEASNLSAQSVEGRGHPAPAEGMYREVSREANRRKSADGSELGGRQFVDNNPPTSELDLVICLSLTCRVPPCLVSACPVH